SPSTSKADDAHVTPAEAAHRYVTSYLAKDWDGLQSQMAERIRTRGLLPQFVQESLGRDGAVQLMSGWLDDDDEVVEVRRFEVEPLGYKEGVELQYLADSAGSRYLVEHHIFIQVDGDGLIEKFDMVCSGWLPLDEGDADGIRVRGVAVP
ncbi:MAG: hypothetical protein ACR2N7_01515, partial [Acidimicrobiia bacterium]